MDRVHKYRVMTAKLALFLPLREEGTERLRLGGGPHWEGGVFEPG